MKIYEVAEGSKLVLIVLCDGKTLNLNTVCVGSKGKDLLVAAVRVDGKVLNISAENIKVSLMLERNNEKPLVWLNCDVKMIVSKGTVNIRLSNKNDGKDFNRRENFRLQIGGRCKARVDGRKDAEEMAFKDVSYSGFALIAEKNCKVDVNSDIRMVYKDEEVQQVLDLCGKVVRIVEQGERKVLGCELNMPSPVLGYYITKKQQKILSSRSGNDLKGNGKV